MFTKTISILCSIIALVFIAGYLSVPVAWSAPDDKKTEILKPDEKNKKGPGDLKDGSKEKKPVKKKAAKKVGTAAAVGVAGSKVKSGVKGKVTKDEE